MRTRASRALIGSLTDALNPASECADAASGADTRAAHSTGSAPRAATASSARARARGRQVDSGWAVGCRTSRTNGANAVMLRFVSYARNPVPKGPCLYAVAGV